ncbi:hypothetical protein G7Y89_g6241 [Cudoniella acicularis]|uniref:Alpha/beta-hydrolase n=1 Tax=Cudoniella acicularis TaxID=354080 RepID=A0A8H4W5Q4_9HELO|nr:hypothetical protein G7Y89_g6241 [Cudoniella acicularis]
MKLLPWLAAFLSSTIATSSQVPLAEDHPHSNFTIYRSNVSPDHSIRIKRQNATLCNTPVDQYTGWLDVGHHHFFFWYFKSENAASADDHSSSEPLALWLTGGPGGSSMLGMLQELGPCLINDYGNGTDYNPYGWNKETALIFVDQPAGVGFSYLDEGEPLPGDSFTSAADMHLFLQLFISQVFPEHENGPNPINAFQGHYLPALGVQIISQNALHPKQPQVPLKSLAIGNGYVSPLDTAFGYWETLCTTNPGVKEPIFNSTRCDIMATNLPRCLDVSKACYDHPDPAICQAASTVCWDGVIKYYDGESYAGGRNRFDITAPCDIDDFCYANTALIQTYLNLPSSFTSLSVPKTIKNYTVLSEAVESAFERTNDLGISLIPAVAYLLENQIDVLIYQGNLDLACGVYGEGVEGMGEWGRKVGTAKEVNVRMREGDEKKTRFALVTIDGSGHMVPQDQPEVALDMLNRWLAGKAFN